jgi:hypothetical protein
MLEREEYRSLTGGGGGIPTIAFFVVVVVVVVAAVLLVEEWMRKKKSRLFLFPLFFCLPLASLIQKLGGYHPARCKEVPSTSSSVLR